MNNDLISREDLQIEITKQIAYMKDRANTTSIYDDKLAYSLKAVGLELARNLIDNAETVEPEITNEDLQACMTESYHLGYELAETKFKRSQGEWIPVSERLPKEQFSGGAFGFDFEEVLCTTIWGDVRAYKFGKPIGHDKPHFWLAGEIMDVYVIAWQYKPEPYKEGGAE